MNEISDQTEIEETLIEILAETDVTVVDPVSGDCLKVIAGEPIPTGYKVIATSS